MNAALTAIDRVIRISRFEGVALPTDAAADRPSASDDSASRAHCLRFAPRLRLDHDWRGTPSPRAAEVALVLDDADLHLAAWVSGPAWVFEDSVPGRCRPGLWQRDVVELFLGDREGDGYREYHLSPGGEWWMGCFAAPRVPAPGHADAGGPATGGRVRIFATREGGAAGSDASDDRARGFACPGGGRWHGVLSLPRTLLPAGFAEACDDAATGSVAGFRANLTAMVGSESRCYLSATPLPGDRPDFHQPVCFVPVAVELL